VEFNVDSIVVSGYREAGKEDGLVAYHQMEIRNGYFERCIMIQQPTVPENSTAEYSEGFLVIRIPKAKRRIHKVYAVRFQIS
jgi:HSP20 family molecular chaperone IbpA